jgi:hypothetical protein
VFFIGEDFDFEVQRFRGSEVQRFRGSKVLPQRAQRFNTRFTKYFDRLSVT